MSTDTEMSCVEGRAMVEVHGPGIVPPSRMATQRIIREIERRFANTVQRLEGEPLANLQPINATFAEILDPYNAGTRDAYGVQQHLVALAAATRLFPTMQDAEHRITTAYHEAGHAVASHLLGIRFVRVTIDPPPSGRCAGFVQLEEGYPNGGARTDMQRLELERHCVMDLCGPAAEDEHGTPAARETCDRHQRDVRRALLQIRPALNDRAIRALTDYLEIRARGLVADHWPAVASLAAALLEQDTLTGPEAVAIIRRALEGPPLSEDTVQ